MTLLTRPRAAGLFVALALALALVAPTSAQEARARASAGGRGKGKGAVEELVQQIQNQRGRLDPSLYRRLTAIGTLESLEAIQKICSSLQNPQALEYAYLALDNYREHEKLEPRAIRWLADECSASKQPTRRAAARALARFGSSASSELQSLVTRSKDEQVRAFAVGGALEAYTDEGTSGALATVMRNARVGTSAPRAVLLEALEAFAEPKLDAEFAASLKSKKVAPDMKLLAIEALTTRERDAVTKALIVALKVKSPEVQVAAMVALDKRGDTTQAGAVSKLIKSKDEAVRRQAIISMGRLNAADEGWIDELGDLARDKDPGTRMGSAVALGELRTSEALEVLYQLLADDDHLVRREALQQLGNMRRKETLPALIMRLNSERGRLKIDLLTTLRLITGLDNGRSYERWKRWWDNEGVSFELPDYEQALRAERKRVRNANEGRTSASFFGLNIVSDRICFVLDVSGSMQAQSGRGTRMDKAKEQLLEVLRVFPDGDLFNVIFFSSDAFPWEDELVTMSKKSRKQALSYVERQTAGGATAIYDALELAFQDRRIDTIYLLTDGVPAGGRIDDPGTIRAEVMRWNANRHIRIHCIAIGTSSPLLKGLAKDTGGDYTEPE